VKAALFKVHPSERRKVTSKIASSFLSIAKMATGSTEFKADADAIAQFQKDKTQFQVFFSQIASQDDATELIEFINDISTFLTVPSDMLHDTVYIE